LAKGRAASLERASLPRGSSKECDMSMDDIQDLEFETPLEEEVESIDVS
jgi:hypothetical protein